jgi:transcriptional regulator with XRE-family HTH domain
MQVLSSRFYRPDAIKPLVHAVRDLGQTIKRLRLEREMTQQEVADACGLDIRYIGSIERGQRNPTLGVLQGIASVFGMKTSELLRKAQLYSPWL